MTGLGDIVAYTSFEISNAYGINIAGQVVGYGYTPDGFRGAFLYSNGLTTGLGTLGGTTSFAFDINDAGQVVGNSYATTTSRCEGGRKADDLV